jgi:hypothetical protein
MEFAFGQILSFRLEGKIPILTSMSDELADCFAEQRYGSVIDRIVVGVVCVEQEFESRFEVRTRFTRREKLLEHGVKLDLEALLSAGEEEARRILGSAILNSLGNIESKKIGDFDLSRFERDLRRFLGERGWLLPGTDANVNSGVLSVTADSHPEDDESESPVPLAEDTFWSIIDRSRAMTFPEIDTQRQCASASELLAALPEEEIVGFELTLRDLIRTANHFKVMAACKICEEYVGDDNYLYFRAGLVSLGRDVYYGTLEDPDACAESLLLNTNGEEVLYIADHAFTKKFGDDTDKPLPRDIAGDYYNYDLAMEEPAGEDWTEEELPHKYPRLWQAARDRRS